MAEDCGDRIMIADQKTVECGLVKDHDGKVHVCMTTALYPDTPIRITWPMQIRIVELLRED